MPHRHITPTHLPATAEASLSSSSPSIIIISFSRCFLPYSFSILSSLTKKEKNVTPSSAFFFFFFSSSLLCAFERVTQQSQIPSRKSGTFSFFPPPLLLLLLGSRQLIFPVRRAFLLDERSHHASRAQKILFLTAFQYRHTKIIHSSLEVLLPLCFPFAEIAHSFFCWANHDDRCNITLSNNRSSTTIADYIIR